MPGLGLVMLAPLAYALDALAPRRAFFASWIYSLTAATIAVQWVVYALVFEYRVSALPAGAFAVIVVGGLALVPGASGAAYARLAPRLSSARAPIAFAAVWTLGEWLRGACLGVPWLLSAQTLARVPIAIQTADLGGSYAVGFPVAALGAGLGIAARRRSLRPLALPLALAAAALAYGAWRLSTLGPQAPTAHIGVVQASVPQRERFRPGSAARNTARHIEATRALVRSQPLDLVVWSETAVDTDLDQTPALRASLEDLARETRVPLLTGAPRSEGGRHTNSVVLIDPDRGLVASYAKQVLVPWSEYDPKLGAMLAPLIGPVTEGVPYTPGDQATVFRSGPLAFSAPVCFEITYPALVARFRAGGAELLVNLSNDAWFGPVGYPQMHLAHAIFRAIETRSWVVRGANTGISAAIDPAGRVVAEIPAFQEGTLVAAVWPAGPLPPYARAGDGPVLVALAALLALALWSPRRPSSDRAANVDAADLPRAASGGGES